MGNKIVDKYCSECGKFIEQVNCSQKYCSDCKNNKKSKSRKKCYYKNKENNRKDIEFEYENNFYSVVKNDSNLIPKNFNKYSKIKVKSYCQIFETNWVDIVKKYNKYNELFNYVKNEYNNFFEQTGYRDLHRFCRENKYITYDLILLIGVDDLMNACNIQKFRYSEEEYKNNFINIKNRLGKVPLYYEFEIYSKISIVSYGIKFNLKGILYDKVVKMYSNNKEYKEYVKMKRVNQFEKIVLDNVSLILNSDYEPQATFDWLVNESNYSLIVDGLFEDYKLIIETDGQQHKKPMGYFGGEEKFKRQQINDELKNKLIPQNGYKLIRVDIDSDWKNINYLRNLLIENNIPVLQQ